MDRARYTAAKALIRQEQGGYSNLVLDAALKKQELTPQQAAFCSSLFYGTLERLLTLDARLAPFLKKPIEKLDPPVRAVLRSGLYQVLYMEVPPAAAVNESVKLMRHLGKTSASGMVNAVLRRACQGGPEPVYRDELHRLSVEYSVGRPIVELLQEAYPDRCEEILKASFARPQLSLRVNTLKTTPEALARELAAEGAETRPGLVPGSLFAQVKGSVTQLETFRQGEFHVQGQASQYAVACLDPREGQRAVDLCAAPGGKSITIAQLMHNTGRLFSCDLQANRLRLIRSGLERCGISNTVVYHGDASEFVEEFCGCDRVLCDVPCSGLGVLAQKPDIRYKGLEELEGLCAIQRAILKNAARYVKPGGKLVYSTCTLNPAENEEAVREFLEGNEEFSLCPPPFALPTGCSGPWGTTIFPDGEGVDGFFVAILQRRKST